MGELVDLVIDPVTRQKVPIELPLAFRVDPEAARHELDIPDFVDLSDPFVAKAVSLLFWARQQSTGGIPLAFLGGTAHRLVCRTSNDPASGLRRSLHDLDIACLHQRIRDTLGFLKAVGTQGGSALAIFETPGDRTFNALQGGRRLRLHTPTPGEGENIGLGIVDLLADDFEFCHRLDLRSDVAAAADHGWTLSPALLLLAKLQYIQRIPVADAPKVPDRVLEPFGKREVLIGAEAKDVRDILAILAEFPFGEAAHAISARRLENLLGNDWGLWRTVGLNLQAVERSPILAGLAPELRTAAESRLAPLVELVRSLTPKRRFTFLSSQWWQEVDTAGPSPTSGATEGPTRS